MLGLEPRLLDTIDKFINIHVNMENIRHTHIHTHMLIFSYKLNIR